MHCEIVYTLNRILKYLPLTLTHSSYFLLFGRFSVTFLQAEEIASKAEELEAQLEKAKDEAREAIHLMRSAYDRNVTVEQCKGGLIIVQAWYGVFGATNKLIDVTIPLQCLVTNSKLILPEHTKVCNYHRLSVCMFLVSMVCEFIVKGEILPSVGHSRVL